MANLRMALLDLLSKDEQGADPNHLAARPLILMVLAKPGCPVFTESALT